MIRTQVQLEKAQIEYIKNVAEEEGVSMAEVIRRSIELLRESREKPSKRELMLRSLNAIGKYESEETDIAINHDQYLDEIYGTW